MVKVPLPAVKPGDPPIDFSHLEAFSGGDRDIEMLVLDTFRDNAPDYLRVLVLASEDGWQSAAHKLKGAARTIGAWPLAVTAEKAEKLGPAGPRHPRKKQLLQQLEQQLRLCLEVIAARK